MSEKKIINDSEKKTLTDEELKIPTGGGPADPVQPDIPDPNRYT